MTRDKLRLLKNRDSNRCPYPITTFGSIGALFSSLPLLWVNVSSRRCLAPALLLTVQIFERLCTLKLTGKRSTSDGTAVMQSNVIVNCWKLQHGPVELCLQWCEAHLHIERGRFVLNWAASELSTLCGRYPRAASFRHGFVEGCGCRTTSR